jgi:hypothetical protein
MIVLAGLIVMLLVGRRVVIVMTDHVRLIVTLVLLAALIATLVRRAVSIVIRVLLVVTVMIVLVGLIEMLLVERRVVIVMTGHVRLIVIHVSRVMTALAGLIGIRVHHALQHKNAQMKLRAALASVAQVAKCLCRPSVLVRIG